MAKETGEPAMNKSLICPKCEVKGVKAFKDQQTHMLTWKCRYCEWSAEVHDDMPLLDAIDQFPNEVTKRLRLAAVNPGENV